MLTKKQYQKEAEPLLRQIFVTDEMPEEREDGEEMPEYRVFAPSVAGRILLYPSDGYVAYPLSEVLVAAAAKLGDSACYVSEHNTFYGDKALNLYIPLSEFLSVYIEPGSQNIEERFKSMLAPDHFVYSCQGQWAIRMTSHGYRGYALLGGSREFTEEITKSYPEIDQQVYEFLEYWQREKEYMLSVGETVYVSDESWFSKVLTHVYGEEAAARMLQETGLP